MSHAASIVADFMQMCVGYGFTHSVRGTTVSITRSFTPQSLDEFSACDMDYPHVAYVLPRSGSVYGTDGGGVGAAQALRTGVFRINITGVRASIIRELTK